MTDTNTTAFQITERPVKGAKYAEEAAVEQKSAADFLAAVDGLLATPGVKAISWTQYTPYFNDGDPCEFSIHTVGVALDEAVFGDLSDTEPEEFYGVDEDEKWFTEYDLYEYKRDAAGKADYGKKKYKVNGVSTKEINQALNTFEGSMGFFEFVVKSNFGDHAQVIATPEGFEVKEYEHD